MPGGLGGAAEFAGEPQVVFGECVAAAIVEGGGALAYVGPVVGAGDVGEAVEAIDALDGLDDDAGEEIEVLGGGDGAGFVACGGSAAVPGNDGSQAEGLFGGGREEFRLNKGFVVRVSGEDFVDAGGGLEEAAGNAEFDGDFLDGLAVRY